MQRRTESGFTLVELMVAMTIFTFVMIVGLAALFAAQASSRRSQAERTIIDNLNFAVENLSRNVRLGYDYTCLSGVNPVDIARIGDMPKGEMGADCDGGDVLVFRVRNPVAGGEDVYGYAVRNTVLPDGSAEYNYLERCVSSNFSGTEFTWQCAPITAPSVSLSSLRFVVRGVNDVGQPSVHLFVEGVALVRDEQSQFTLQTFLSQRQFEQ